MRFLDRKSKFQKRTTNRPDNGSPECRGRRKPLVSLQRSIGNQAMQRLLRPRGEEPTSEVPGNAQYRVLERTAELRGRVNGHEDSEYSLRVSAPEVRDEQQAERVADRVMRLSGRNGLSKRQNSKHIASANPTRLFVSNPNWRSRSGRPLPNPIRAYFESRLDSDFSSVRIHHDSKSAETPQSTDPRAYTFSEDIVFGAGHYAPETMSGKRLLAHELAHVMQQREPGESYRVQMAPPADVDFSIDANAFNTLEEKLTAAVLRLREIAEPRTFVYWAVPGLSRLTDMITYRDSEGRNHDGDALEINFPGVEQPFMLRLVLDDRPEPTSDGYFELDSGAEGMAARIGLNIRRGIAGKTVEDIGELLYHESMHLFSHWFRTIGAENLPSVVPTVRARLELSAYEWALELVENHVETILGDVNASRDRDEPFVDSAEEFARNLVEEAMVRGETMFMELMSGRRRSSAYVGLSESEARRQGQDAASYLFTHGDMLQPDDRQALNEASREAFERIRLILGEVCYEHVYVRWGPTEALPAPGIPERMPSL